MNSFRDAARPNSMHTRNKFIHSSQKDGNRQGIRVQMTTNAASVYHYMSGVYIVSDRRFKYCECKCDDIDVERSMTGVFEVFEEDVLLVERLIGSYDSRSGARCIQCCRG